MDYVNVSVNGRIATVELSIPPVNALNSQCYLELSETFRTLSKRADVGAVLLCSRGKGFVSGNDVNDVRRMTKESHHAYQDVLCAGVESIINCRQPVVGAVQGYALGAGLVLAAACDVVVASEDAWFGLPEVTLAIVSGAGYARLMFPEKVARYMALTGKSISAQKARELGGVQKLAPKENLRETAFEIAAQMAAAPPQASVFFKEALNLNANMQTARHFLIETLHTDRLFGNAEKEESIAAFFEKRPAVYAAPAGREFPSDPTGAHEYVTLEVADRVATVAINKPPVNALNAACYRQIAEVFEGLNRRGDIGVIVLRAEGKGFLAGNDIGDIRNMTMENHPAYQAGITRSVASILNSRFPVICAVHGYVVGAGIAFAAASDIVLAAEKTRFSLPEVNLAIVGGASFASALMPEKVARYLALTGNTIPVEDLQVWGGIAEVVPQAELPGAAEALAAQMAKLPPRTLEFFKQALDLNGNAQLDKKFQIENLYANRLFAYEEKSEALNAWLEKRAPHYHYGSTGEG